MKPMHRFLLSAAILLFTACSQQRFEVLQQGSAEMWTVVYDRQTGKFVEIGSGGEIRHVHYPD
jgi:hypothetical protein